MSIVGRIWPPIKPSDHTLTGQDTPRPQYAGQDMPMPQDAGQDMPMPQDADQDLPMPQDAGQDMPMSQDAGQDLPRPQEAGQDIPMPQNAGQDLPRPQEAGQDMPMPQYAGRGPNHIEEFITKITSDIVKLDGQIVNTEKKIEEVHGALRIGGECCGEKGSNLMKEKDRLIMKEQQLRREKELLREEKIILLKRTCGDKSESDESYEESQLAQLEQVHRVRYARLSGLTGDIAGTDTVNIRHKIEEDPRLMTRLGAFGNPILVSTLVAGFNLVLFDVAATETPRELAILSFGLEVTASIVLSLIAFRGQQLYSHATDVNPLARDFLHRMLPLTIFGLVAFALGIAIFVISFVLEASEDIGESWIGVLGIAFCPTVIAGILFVVSTLDVRRHSIIRSE